MEEISAVLCPMQEEYDELVGELAKAGIEGKEASYGPLKGLGFSVGSKGKFFAFVARIGKANIGFDLGVLSSLVSIKEIYVIGVAGSLSPDIVPLSIVVADRVCYYDVDVTEGGKYRLGQMAGEEDLYFYPDQELLKKVDDVNTTLTVYKGTILSGDSFATKKNMNEEMLKNFESPLAVDMESGAAAQIAHRLKVPFFVIRGISDQVNGESNGAEFSEFLNASARRAATMFVHLVTDDVLKD